MAARPIRRPGRPCAPIRSSAISMSARSAGVGGLQQGLFLRSARTGRPWPGSRPASSGRPAPSRPSWPRCRGASKKARSAVEQAGAVDARSARRGQSRSAAKAREVAAHPAVAAAHRQLLGHRKRISPVRVIRSRPSSVSLKDDSRPGQPTRKAPGPVSAAPARAGSGWIMPNIRPARQRVLGHREVARLEDVQRQRPPRQQQRAGQREDRELGGQILRTRVRKAGHLAEQDRGQLAPRRDGRPDRRSPRPRRISAAACAPRPRSICGRGG